MYALRVRWKLSKLLFPAVKRKATARSIDQVSGNVEQVVYEFGCETEVEEEVNRRTGYETRSSV